MIEKEILEKLEYFSEKYQGKIKEIIENIIKNDDLNYHNDEKKNILHISSIFGFVDIFQVLIEYKIDVNKTDNFGKNAIMYSIENSNKEIFSLILKYHNDSGIINSDTYYFKKLIDFALENKDLYFINKLLDFDLNLNFSKNNESKLFLETGYIGRIIKYKDIQLFRKFIEKLNYDEYIKYINKLDHFGQTAFTYIIKSNLNNDLKKDFVKILIYNKHFLCKQNTFNKQDTFKNLNFEIKDNSGYSFLDYVVILGDLDIFVWFIDFYFIVRFIELELTKERSIGNLPKNISDIELIDFYKVFLIKTIKYSKYDYFKISYEILINKRKNIDNFSLEIIKILIEEEKLQFIEYYFSNDKLKKILDNNQNKIVEMLINNSESSVIDLFLQRTDFLNWTLLWIYKTLLKKISLKKNFIKIKINKISKILYFFLFNIIIIIILLLTGIFIKLIDKFSDYILK